MEKYCARTCKFCNDKETTSSTTKEVTTAETTAKLFPSSTYYVCLEELICRNKVILLMFLKLKSCVFYY